MTMWPVDGSIQPWADVPTFDVPAAERDETWPLMANEKSIRAANREPMRGKRVEVKERDRLSIRLDRLIHENEESG
jgi:hypothetical protein